MLEFRPKRNPSLVDFHDCVHAGWLECIMDFILWPLDCWSRPSGKLTREGVGRSSGHMLHVNTLWKIERIIWGTWESNPGPSTSCHYAFANWAIQRVCYMNGQQLLYKKNNGQAGNTKNARQDLNALVAFGQLTLLLHLPCKRKQDSGGFKPPQTKSAENSD